MKTSVHFLDASEPDVIGQKRVQDAGNGDQRMATGQRTTGHLRASVNPGVSPARTMDPDSLPGQFR